MIYLFGILGMIGGAALVKYRVAVGDMLGEADWMRYVGGSHIFVTIIGVFLFFYSIAAMTGTTEILLAPIVYPLRGISGS